MRALNLDEAEPLKVGDTLELEGDLDMDLLGAMDLLCLRVKDGDGLVVDDLGQWMIEKQSSSCSGLALVVNGIWKNPAFRGLPVNVRVTIHRTDGGLITFV